MAYSPYKPTTEAEIFLCKVLTTLNSPEESADFLRDICTLAEIKELANRLDIARKLQEGKLSYRQIAKENKTSTTTVGRVALFLKEGKGYGRILKEVK